jgi:hypothetical protein
MLTSIDPSDIAVKRTGPFADEIAAKAAEFCRQETAGSKAHAFPHVQDVDEYAGAIEWPKPAVPYYARNQDATNAEFA